MTLHLSYPFGFLQIAIIVYQIFQCTHKVIGAVDDLDVQFGTDHQQYIIGNGLPALDAPAKDVPTEENNFHDRQQIILLPEPINELMLSKRAFKPGKSRKLRSGYDKSRYKGGMKWKKYPESPMKAGEIARLLMEIAERRGIPYNNKAIRYGLS